MPKVGQTLPIVEEDTDNGYSYFMDTEPREYLGPIRMEQDGIFGRKVKVRTAKIGMVRNASAVNRKEVKVFLEPYPHIRIDGAKPLQGWYRSKHEDKSGRPRTCYTEALLTSPYMGCCPNSCLFCYVNAGGRGYRNTGLVVVPMNYGDQIRKQLTKIMRGSAGYITSFHDPFNIMEGIYHNSQECAKAFTEVGLPIFFLSRLRYPDWAIDALTQNKYSYAQKSINTPDPDDWHKLSPRVPPLDKQFEDIRRLKAKGVYVSIQVNSIIPGVTSNEQIIELFRLLADAGTDHVITKFVECAYAWAPAMIEKMIENFGERGKKFAALLNQNIGGERTIDENYRMAAHKLFRAEATRLGMTYSVCFEFKWDRNVDGSVKNKTGISIGPEFTTSAQCHGQRVPVYTRASAEDVFHPIKMCPPSGCLYCADNNGGVPKCGDRIAGNALALRMPQLRLPILRK